MRSIVVVEMFPLSQLFLEVDIDDFEIGIPIEAVFAPKAQRTGSILDVKYFRPTGR